MRRLIIILLVFLTSCSGLHSPSKSPRPRPETVKPPPAPPVNREKALGRQFMQTALKEYDFVLDYEVVSQVNRVGKEILEAIGEDPNTFHFFVVRQNQLNAFAVPGGYIFLFDGLLKQLKTVDALAGVLAHEIAHVQKKHFFNNAKKLTAINLATMASIILAGLTGEAIGATSTIAAAANISFQLKFSRANEEDADLHAIRYLKQTRYNPAGLSEFFKTLSFYAGFSRGVAPPYFSTHPGLSERRFMVESLTQNYFFERSLPFSTTPNWREDWGRVVAILKSGDKKNLDPISAQPTTKTPKIQDARQRYLAGLTAFRAGRLQEATKLYQSAIQSDPDEAIYYADLSKIWMQLQKAELAKEAARSSLARSKKHATPHLVLGMIAQSEENHESAIKHLEAAKRLSPEDPFIYLQLARSYHLLSNLPKERFHLAKHHRLNLAPQKAMLLFQSALSLLDERSPLAVEIKGEMEGIARDGV